MKVQFENIYRDLTEIEHLLERIVAIPEELFDMQDEWTERQFEWLERLFEWPEDKESRKDAPFGSYMFFLTE